MSCPLFCSEDSVGSSQDLRQEIRAWGAAWPLGQVVCGQATVRSSRASSSQSYWSWLNFLIQKVACPRIKSSCLVAPWDQPSETQFRGALVALLPPLPLKFCLSPCHPRLPCCPLFIKMDLLPRSISNASSSRKPTWFSSCGS